MSIHHTALNTALQHKEAARRDDTAARDQLERAVQAIEANLAAIAAIGSLDDGAQRTAAFKAGESYQPSKEHIFSVARLQVLQAREIELTNVLSALTIEAENSQRAVNAAHRSVIDAVRPIEEAYAIELSDEVEQLEAKLWDAFARLTAYARSGPHQLTFPPRSVSALGRAPSPIAGLNTPRGAHWHALVETYTAARTARIEGTSGVQ
jgi:hypothetical protein